MTPGTHHRSAMRVALVVISVCFGLRLVLSAHLDLFGDEAFYWQAGQHLAWAYSDLPGLTAWLIATGVTVLGHEVLGVRLLFILIGLLLPFALVWSGRPLVGPRDAWLGAAATSLVPLLAMTGVLALPDVTLLLLAVLALGCLARAMQGQRAYWVLLGLVLALSFACHYRGVVTAACAALAVLISAQGRAQLSKPWPWLGALIALLGVWPILWFNLAYPLAGVSFQMVNRHPWSFQWEGLMQPLIQALATTPLIYVALLAGAVLAMQLARRGDPRATILAVFGLVPVLGFFVLGLWADQERSNVHWPLQGYLALLLLLPRVLRKLRPWMAALVCLSGFVGSLLFAAYLWTLTEPERSWGLQLPLPDNLVGWRDVAERVDGYLASSTQDTRIVADNFMLAAQLAFARRDARAVYVLDHPRNVKHGRALQYRIWDLDQRSLQRQNSQATILVQEEDAVRFGQLLKHRQALCDVFEDLEPLEQVLRYQGRRQFRLFWSERTRSRRESRAFQEGRNTDAASACHLPPMLYLDEAEVDASGSGSISLRGWAFGETRRIVSVQARLRALGSNVDTERVVELVYGKLRPEVARLFKSSRDPNHPRVGFSGSLSLTGMPDGPLDLVIEAIDSGGVRSHWHAGPVERADSEP